MNREQEFETWQEARGFKAGLETAADGNIHTIRITWSGQGTGVWRVRWVDERREVTSHA